MEGHTILFLIFRGKDNFMCACAGTLEPEDVTVGAVIGR